jgi:hypothetical protein
MLYAVCEQVLWTWRWRVETDGYNFHNTQEVWVVMLIQKVDFRTSNNIDKIKDQWYKNKEHIIISKNAFGRHIS